MAIVRVCICGYDVIYDNDAGSNVGSGNMIVPSTYSSSGLHGAGGMPPAGEHWAQEWHTYGYKTWEISLTVGISA